MGPEEKLQPTDCMIYVDGVPVGTLGAEIPTITLTARDEADLPPITMDESTITLHFTATRWTTCRNRKRFIKLMGGVLGVQRNAAQRLADKAMANGCPSYMDLWADCYTYFIECVLSRLAAQPGTTAASAGPESSNGKE